MSERHYLYQMKRLDQFKVINTLSKLLVSLGLTVIDVYVIGSQVFGGKPPRVDSDFDLLFMVDGLDSTKPVPVGMQGRIELRAKVLEKRFGREIHVQLVSSGPFPIWLKDKNHKRIYLRRGN